MTANFVPVILAGGKGERFWPLSRRHRPKQFLCLDGTGISLLQATAQRLLALAGGWPNLWVITAAPIASGIREQLPQLPDDNLLIEPEGRDTAPAVAWASLEVAKRYGDEAVLGFFPADHWIGDQGAFEQTLTAAIDFAQQTEAIVTLGIQPTHPATGYGYIEQGLVPSKSVGLLVYPVSRFTEKPDLSTAEAFIKSGRYSWNSGMFFFRAGVVLAELERHAPQLLQALREQGVEAYGSLEKISIDYALMEKTQRAYVLPVNFGWDDLGDWNALERLLPAQGANVNVANHVAQESQGCIVYASDPGEVVVTLGLEDLVIVRDGNVTLVARKDQTQAIKTVLKRLAQDDTYQSLL
ncbi:mannose-1-phosphate guanylyltransferase [Synechocystis sp. LKSZ1]|uniref:mannose-1-phosphate guanylyltransferase n=1 Tax=Synechocystis sp. LKSZ1 TaxID=3144951 RepID=UPI00336BE3A7